MLTFLADAAYLAMTNQWCPVGDPEVDRMMASHCEHWFDCEPCDFCGFDGGGEDGGCDCPRHNPGLYDENGDLLD